MQFLVVGLLRWIFAIVSAFIGAMLAWLATLITVAGSTIGMGICFTAFFVGMGIAQRLIGAGLKALQQRVD